MRLVAGLHVDLRMAQTSPLPEAQRTALADVIERRGSEILERWLARVEKEMRDPELTRTELRDAMPSYLGRLALALRTADSVEIGGASAWAEVATEHALTRVRLGFDIDELVHEFVVLRQIMLAVVAEEMTALDWQPVAHISDLLGAAIEVAVKAYVESRDYAARKLEAEHINFISHELRSPLGAAVLSAERLRKTPTALDADAIRALDLLERNLNRIRSLVDEVLAVGRLESGKVEPHLRPMTLGEVLAPALVAARIAADAKGLSFVVRVDDEAMVEVDPDLTASAISNVVDNAVKYTDVGTVEVKSGVGTDTVTLHVRDNCPGMSPEELSIIFEPFRRGFSNKPGSGLGLAIARRALEAQGGSVEAESGHEERGCEFRIHLPRVQH
jgi:signal transduction histidine kinase